MTIANATAIEEFLEGTAVVEVPSGSSVPFFRSPNFPTFALQYPDTSMTLPSMLHLIGKELLAAGCANSPDIATAVLGVLATTRQKSESAVDHANACFRRLHTVDLFQYLVLPMKLGHDYEADLGRMCIKTFSPDRLLYWSQRGGSKYPVDLTKMAGRTSLERRPFTTPVLDLDAMPDDAWRHAAAVTPLMPQVLHDAYYSAVFEHHLSEVPELLRRDLLILEAAGLIHVDIDSFLNAPLVQRFGLFRWKKNGGRQRSWAVLSGLNEMRLNFVPPGDVSSCRAWLHDTLRFSQLDLTKPLDRTVDTFCGFLQRAHEHRINGRLNEAALHFVIALDLVLGEEGRSAESVADRAALLVHRQRGVPLDVAVGMIKKVYNARSKFVHEGQPFPVETGIHAEQIATEVLWSLLAVAGEGHLTTTDQWLTKIAYLLAALRDRRAVADAEFSAIGVPASGVPRVPPNRVRENEFRR